MSERFSMMNASAFSDKRMKLTDLRVLGAIGSYVNSDTREVYPSQVTLSDTLGIARPNINAALKRLEACGYIRKLERRKTGQWTYVVVFDDVCDGIHVSPDIHVSPEITDVIPRDNLHVSPDIHKQTREQTSELYDALRALLSEQGRGRTNRQRTMKTLTKLLGRHTPEEITSAVRVYAQKTDAAFHSGLQVFLSGTGRGLQFENLIESQPSQPADMSGIRERFESMR